MKETMKKLMEVFITCHFLISVAIGSLWYDSRTGHQCEVCRYVCTYCDGLFLDAPHHAHYLEQKKIEKQIVLRKVLQILMVEAIVHFVFMGSIVLAVSVLLVFVGVFLIDWVLGWIEVEKLNRRLVQLQKGENSE